MLLNNTRLMAIFQDNLGKLVPECHHFGFCCSKDVDVVVTTGAIRHAKLQSSRYHQ